MDKFKQSIEAYDKSANSFAEFFSKHSHEEEMHYFVSLLPEKKVLDAGCGAGKDVEFLVKHGIEAIGVDLSEKLLEIARKEVNAEFKLMDLRKLDFTDNTFGGLISMMSLIHLSREDALTALKEFNRVLVKNGVIFLVVYEGEGEAERRQPEHNNALRHYTLFTLHEIESLLEQAGFEILKKTIKLGGWKDKIRVFARKS